MVADEDREARSGEGQGPGEPHVAAVLLLGPMANPCLVLCARDGEVILSLLCLSWALCGVLYWKAPRYLMVDWCVCAAGPAEHLLSADYSGVIKVYKNTTQPPKAGKSATSDT